MTPALSCNSVALSFDLRYWRRRPSILRLYFVLARPSNLPQANFAAFPALSH
jgi:hypothetical protein